MDTLGYCSWTSTKACALTGVARLRVHGDHHFASRSSPGSQGALQRGDAAGRLVAVASYDGRESLNLPSHGDAAVSVDAVPEWLLLLPSWLSDWLCGTWGRSWHGWMGESWPEGATLGAFSMFFISISS